MPTKAILFDMFDTLMLIEHDHAFYEPSLKRMHKFLVESGVKVSFSEFKGAYLKARDALYAEADAKLEEPHFNVRISNALRHLGFNFDVNSDVVAGATNAFCEGFMEYVRIDEHTTGVLQKLYGKYKLGIVSNFAIPECVTKLLALHGLSKFFDVVIVSGAVNKRKPSPEIFLKALEQLGVNAAEAVFVGDTVDADVKGAKSVGMKTIFIERRVQKEAAQACPDQTIKRLSELTTALERC
ncbi:MAG: HAD family hydrolase [Candidatus Bathyarchaeota archaeon]|nr:HAD family hydrolase [Candidatus Bathyarchaeota archaeon]